MNERRKLEVSIKVMRVVDSGHDEQNPVLLASVNLTHSNENLTDSQVGETGSYERIVADRRGHDQRKTKEMGGPLFIVSDTNPVIWERVSFNNPSPPSCREPLRMTRCDRESGPKRAPRL